jgi:hypothetical protein
VEIEAAVLGVGLNAVAESFLGFMIRKACWLGCGFRIQKRLP